MKSPRLHGVQWRQLPPNQPTATRSPTCQTSCVPSPSSSIRPAISCPGTTGNRTPGSAAFTKSASLWQTPQASTDTRTCPGPGCGTARSTISNGPPAAVACAAR